MTDPARRPPAVWAVALVLLFTHPLAAADDTILGPSYGVLPMQSPELNRLGLTVGIELAQVTGPGYVPLRIEIEGRGAAAADLRLVFRVTTRLGDEFPPPGGLIIDVPVTVAQGARQTSVTRYLPKWSLGQSVDVTLFADGQRLHDDPLRIVHGGQVRVTPADPSGPPRSRVQQLAQAGLGREIQRDWLLIRDRDQSGGVGVEALEGSSPGIERRLTAEENRAVVPPLHEGMRSIEVTTLDQLPSDWRGYQSYDTVVISAENLAQLSTQSATLGGLRDWILLGGAIVVYEVVHPDQPWEQLNFRQSTGAEDQPPGSAEESSQPSADSAGTAASAAGEPRLARAPAGAGMVITIAAVDDSEPPAADEPEAALPPNSVWDLVARWTGDRSSPMLRRGADPLTGTLRFQQWTVPGVLQPPVYSFMALLTLFVIFVGPVAYRQTVRHGRSHLMFAIAPLLALITTLAMFAYGVLSDGFGTKSRIRQLTWIDGRSGDAGEYVLGAYFAGIRPADGLRFAGEAEVMRQVEPAGLTLGELNQQPPAHLGSLRVTGESQVFDASFLPSRDQRQFITHAPRARVGSLQWLASDGTDPEPRLSSTLPFPLQQVIVHQGDQQYWEVVELSARGTSICQPLSRREASRRLSAMYNAYRPLAELVSNRSERFERALDSSPLEQIAAHHQLGSAAQAGLFEQWLQQNLQSSGALPQGHFVAMTSVSEDVVAVAGAEVVDSVRYVFGTLK